MTLAIAQKLWELAAAANPTPEKMAEIIKGWDELFFRLGLRPEEEKAEFDAIMRARVKVGVISIVADRFIGQNAYPSRLGEAYMDDVPKGNAACFRPHRLSDESWSIDARLTDSEKGTAIGSATDLLSDRPGQSRSDD